MPTDPKLVPLLRELVDKVREKLYSSGLDDRGMTEVRAIPVAGPEKAARLEIFFGNVRGFAIMLEELPRCEFRDCGKPLGAHDWVTLDDGRYHCGEHSRGKICATCNDTHTMSLGDREVPCTFCPRPCEACRAFYQGVRLGAYCETTPCPCRCHAPVEDASTPRRARRRT